MSIEKADKKPSPISPYIAPQIIIVRRPSGRLLEKEIADNRLNISPILFSKQSQDEIKILKERINELEKDNKTLWSAIHAKDKTEAKLRKVIIGLKESLDENVLNERIKHLEYMEERYKIQCRQRRTKIPLTACGSRIKRELCKGECRELKMFLIELGIQKY